MLYYEITNYENPGLVLLEIYGNLVLLEKNT